RFEELCWIDRLCRGTRHDRSHGMPARGYIIARIHTLKNDALSRYTCISMKVSPRPRERAILGQVSDLDLRLMRVFKAVVECGGMAAAELELNIGTSTVSRHVKDLETRLGLRLCRRGRGGFAL